jgi:predicted P-loop ATPase/GTPase
LEQAVERQSNSAAPYFEVLVRSTALAGAPVSFTIVAVRIIQPE